MIKNHKFKMIFRNKKSRSKGGIFVFIALFLISKKQRKRFVLFKKKSYLCT